MVSLCPVWMPASPRSSEDRVLASEARCVGSNPAGGTITGSKFMHIFARFRKKDWGRRIGAFAVAMAMLALMAAAVACDPEGSPTDRRDANGDRGYDQSHSYPSAHRNPCTYV